MKAVILAGGSGTRLWPLSRKAKPKQFSSFAGGETLIRDTYRRLLRLFPQESIYFCVTPELVSLLRADFPEVKESQIIVEPFRRDTGPAMGYAASRLAEHDADEPIAFIPSDHYIKDEELFLRCVQTGDRLIRATGKLVDIGVEPIFPSTILGYTKIGSVFETQNAIEVYHFAGHKEKPDYDAAKRYIESGEYLWHANYYMWTPRRFLEAFARHAPLISEELARLREGTGSYERMPTISIDYAVTEKLDLQDVLIIKGTFGWSDVGAWDTLYAHLSEKGENITQGLCVTVDTSGSLIYAPQDKLVAVIGMQDTVIVDTKDVLLVCKKQDAQRVKEAITLLEKNGHDAFL